MQRRTGGSAEGLLEALPEERSQGVREEAGATMHRIVSGGQLAAAGLALAYVARYLPPREPVNVQVTMADPFADSEAKQFSSIARFWRLEDEGVADARAQAGRYARALAEGDVKAAARVGLDAGAAASRMTVRWRKVPGPTACEWCRTIAEEARYHSAETVPFHTPLPNGSGGVCVCGVAPEYVEERLTHAGRWQVPRGARGEPAGPIEGLGILAEEEEE